MELEHLAAWVEEEEESVVGTSYEDLHTSVVAVDEVTVAEVMEVAGLHKRLVQLGCT